MLFHWGGEGGEGVNLSLESIKWNLEVNCSICSTLKIVDAEEFYLGICCGPDLGYRRL